MVTDKEKWAGGHISFIELAGREPAEEGSAGAAPVTTRRHLTWLAGSSSSTCVSCVGHFFDSKTAVLWVTDVEV